jgi:hypothetical protein
LADTDEASKIEYTDFYKWQTINEYNGWNIKVKQDNGVDYLKGLVDKIKKEGESV